MYYKSCACGEKGTETFEYGEYAAHTLVKTDRVEPTCIENGTEAYYTCSHCDKIFADANANREINAPAEIDALGHDTEGVNWTPDGDVHYKLCKREGCGAHVDEVAHSGGTASCEANGAHSRQNGKSRSYLRKRRHGSLLDVLGMRQTVL